jgi:isoamylase
MNIWPGQPYPLGAHFDGIGTNFSIFSEIADRVTLCLFDADGNEEQIDLPETTAFHWHGYVPNVGVGQRYGYRVWGPHDPTTGLRCNPAKLLLDPYSKAIDGNVTWDESVFDYRFKNNDQLNDTDDAPFMPKSVVASPWFDWETDRRPRTPWAETVVYEVHVKGFTQNFSAVPAEIRGTYAGLASEPAIKHFKELGVTTVELLPVHQFIHDSMLEQKGLRNYWGYNSIGYLAPHHEYCSSGATGQQVQEFKYMVKELHRNGIEVILDVVYNHTAEGNEKGPTLSFRGIDNPAYYRLMPNDQRYYMDYTGTGNSMNMRSPHVLQLIMDSLRYWVTEMHVDGFRFDLAATLARELHDVDRLSSFFDLIQQDPVVSQVKLIAEPWDVGEGGYQVGNFPPLWSEWNGKYRDCVRDFWRGEDQTLAELAYRFTGSSDLYERNGRRPSASINFITAHDGFTLADLVSYNEKHNEDNGEDNNDGTTDNRSWNCGAEGPTKDADVLALRQRQQRNFLATLFLSQGIPMLLGGDEFARTQNGNNNSYCQDNETSWFDWRLAEENQGLMQFVSSLILLRKRHPVLRRRYFFQGRPLYGEGISDIAWMKPDGSVMGDSDWNKGFAKSITVFLNGDQIDGRDEHGQRITDDSFLVLLNAHYEPLAFTIPDKHYGARWETVFDTSVGIFERRQAHGANLKPGDQITLEDRSLVLLRNCQAD